MKLRGDLCHGWIKGHNAWAWLAAASLVGGCSLDRAPRIGTYDVDQTDGRTGGVVMSGGLSASGGQTPGGVVVSGGALMTGGVASSGGKTPEPDVACDLRGSWALKAVVDVAWGGRPSGLAMLTDDGRGSIEVLARVNIEEVGSDGSVRGKARVCGVQLPPFYSTIAGWMCESYQPVFDSQLWDSPKMPLPELEGSMDCPTVDECRASFGAARGLFGVELDDPALFPTADQTPNFSCKSGQGVDCFPDHDDDQRPGVGVTLVTTGLSPGTSPYCSEYPMRGAPLSDNPSAIFDGVRRADRIDLGISAELQPDLVLDPSCDRGHGGGQASGFDSRAIACMIEPGTFDVLGFGMVSPPAGPMEACTSKERLFMDENLPVYAVLGEGDVPAPHLELSNKAPSAGPRFTVVRLEDSKDGCGPVLAARF